MKFHPRRFFPALILLFFIPATFSIAADREQIEIFLTTTGFDKSLESMADVSTRAPQMLGIAPEDFGADWTRLAQEVFDSHEMNEEVISILEQTLDDKALNHAVLFYASELGQRLVIAENASYSLRKQGRSENSAEKSDEINPARIELFERMYQVINENDASIKAWQEIQIRFLLAASASGVIEMYFDDNELRKAMRLTENHMRQAMRRSTLKNNIHIYQDFSNSDIETYIIALEHPLMRQVYQLLNAAQYEIKAQRFEVLADRMSEFKPARDI